MKPGLDRLKSAYREHVRSLIPPTRGHCPPIEDLMRFFTPGPSRRFKTRIIDHVSGCGPCAEEFEILIGIDRATRSFAESAANLVPERSDFSRSRKATRGFWALGRLATAGSGLALLAIVLWILIDRPTSPSDEDMALRSVEKVSSIALIEPSGSLNEKTTIVFRWRISGEKAKGTWAVSLFDDSLVLIWESPPNDAGYVPLPPDIRSALESGRKYYWGISLVSEESESDSDLAVFWVERRVKSSPNPVTK